MNQSQYPSKEDLQIRWTKVQNSLKESDANACLIATNVNIYYLTGRIFTGFVYLSVEGDPICFVQRPVDLQGENVIHIRKPEDIPCLLQKKKLSLPSVLLLETDQITHNEFLRLETAFNPKVTGNATPVLRKARMTKTPWEIEQLRISAKQHAETYQQIPSVFSKNMKDVEFQYEIERLMRKNGSLGIFRTFGNNMDIFMGSLLAGKNAETPSPYDFALGGGGLNPCLPIGVNGEKIQPGQTVMVDMAGNFTAYITDMTRVYSYGTLPDIVYQAHRTSIRMHNCFMETVKPGIACADIYNRSIEMVEEAGFAAHFMGTVQQAKFVGHGVGIEINELPVLMKRSKDLLQTGMVIAYEPKFVFPDIGAVGIENTFLITETGTEKLTVLNEEIVNLI
ncbi:MAG: Xaa-Pro peptidase family protein [Dysgonamonadaceae bacterium]|jgi:Xaa-Pro aminopeptidase|nr:Xaa-Pro peptidase family protein [Dysgonamonadaceae bacterium]